MANAFKKTPRVGWYNRLIFTTYAEIEKHAPTIAQVFAGITQRGSTARNELQTAAE